MEFFAAITIGGTNPLVKTNNNIGVSEERLLRTSFTVMDVCAFTYFFVNLALEKQL